MTPGTVTPMDYRTAQPDTQLEVERVLSHANLDVKDVAELRARAEFLADGSQVFEADVLLRDPAGNHYAIVVDGRPRPAKRTVSFAAPA